MDEYYLKWSPSNEINNLFNRSSYDPHVSKEGAAAGPPSKTVEIQKKIDETVEVMRDNLKSVAGRGERLDTLQDKTENLSVSAQGFRHGANKVRKRMWWKDMKMRIIIAVAVIILLLVIILPIVLNKN